MKGRIAVATLATAAGVSAQTTLEPFMYNYLPLGAVKPNGWLTSQLQLQADGLAGNEMNFYDYVQDGLWTGGNSTYSDLNEGPSYWFNGLVGTAFLLNDATLLSQVGTFLDYVLDHQASDGWIGPQPQQFWGRYPFMLGAMQYAEASPADAPRIVDALMNFTALANSMLNDNYTGVEEWGAARWQDYTVVLQWLYENYANGQEEMLLDTMTLLQASGTNWTQIFSPSEFPTGDVGTNATVYNHGVNLGQALKEGAVAYRFTHEQVYMESTAQRWDILYQYHGRPSGIFCADEHLCGLAANRGSELCMVVETMYSGTYTWQMFGNNTIADMVEKMAYNALPAELTGNMWSRQYLQQTNQIWAKTLDPNIFATDGDYSNVFGLEPNYPCCTVNHPQGFPKFISNAFVTDASGSSLIQAYLGPFTVSATLPGTGNQVDVVVDTNYPFADTFTMTINATDAYTHYVRIPDWAQRNGTGTYAINGGSAQAVSANSAGLLAISIPAGQTTTITMTLPASIDVTYGNTGGAQVSRGPLFFSSDIFRSQTVLAQNSEQPNAVDLQYLPTVNWEYAIDPTTLAFHNTLPETLPSPVYDSQQPPNTITAVGCPIAWTTTSGSADDPPSSPATCTGDTFNFIFWPYGSTKLRIGELPWFNSS